MVLKFFSEYFFDGKYNGLLSLIKDTFPFNKSLIFSRDLGFISPVFILEKKSSFLSFSSFTINKFNNSRRGK